MIIKSNKLGFTLIELIVVITIISVLTVVAIVSFGGSSKKSRDARRMADLEKIRIALEIYRQENKGYPASASALYPPSANYLPAWPTDPKGYSYSYVRGATVYLYNLYGKMEDAGSTMACSSCPANCGGTDGKCNYNITNP